MGEDGYGYSGVWNICSSNSLVDVVILVYYWDYLQLVSCALLYYLSAGVDWYLEQIEDLKSAQQTQSDVLVKVLDIYIEHSC